MVIRPDGVFYAPHQVVDLTPGASVQIEVVSRPPVVYRTDLIAITPQWAGFTVETDAPPSVLRIRRWIQRREEQHHLPDGEEETFFVPFGVVELRAIEAENGERAEAIYEVRLGTPDGGFPGPLEIEVDATPMRFRVVPPSPEITCEALVLSARSDPGLRESGRFFRRLFEGVSTFRSGRITVRAPGFGVGLRLFGPYRYRGGELTETLWDPSAQRQPDDIGVPSFFAAGMSLWPAGSGFEQTFDLGWFDDLEFLAHAPGCEPRRIRCSLRGGCSSD